MKSKLILLLVLMIASWSLQAEHHEAAVEKPSFSATQEVQLTAVIEAIDKQAMTVTLRGPEGNTRTLKADPASDNINRIAVGDKVDVEYVQHLSIEVFANEGMEQPGAGVLAASGINEDGETPARMDVITTVETAVVEEINIEANTFKLRWPGDEVQEYIAQNPDNLKKAAVGDMVVVTHTEAIAMMLQETDAE